MMARQVPEAEENLGHKIQYDPIFDGPLKRRSCTDVICLLFFLVFIVGWAAIGFWAVKEGDPSTLLTPSDSSGLRCGLDPLVEHKPFLFFFDLTKCIDPSVPFLGCPTTQVCVETCPSTTFYTGQNETAAIPYCTYKQRATNQYNSTYCPTWFLPSEQFFKRCIYNVADRKRLKIASIIEGDEISRLKEYLDPVHLFVHNALSLFRVKNDSNLHKVADQVIADIMSSWWKILLGVGLALVACIIYILMLRWVAGFMVWLSIGGVLAALSAASYFSYVAWQKWKKDYETNGDVNRLKTKRDLFLGIFIIVVAFLAIILLILIFLRKRIVLAIALIKEGSKAVGSVTSVLFFPIVPWLMQIAVVAYAICVGVFLATTGEPLYQYRQINPECRAATGWTVETACNPNNFTITDPTCVNATCKFAKIANEAYYPYLQAINVFGFFWLAFFVSALGQMVLAQVFAQWYWTMKKRHLPFFALTSAFYRTIRYHLGTLAFGSLIIAICRMIRLCLEYLDRKLKKYDNEITKAIMCCLKCFFWCLENFLKFINKNAYIMCAIHGKNFCGSAKDAFMLLMRNIVRVFVLDKVTDFLFFLSKLLVTVGIGAVAYLFFATNMISFMDNSQLNYGEVPVIIIMIVTYLIASLFFSVYSMAVDTLFLCFLEDSERNNGKDKPYYMSRNLMKIFGKRNKQHEGPKIE
ncbi:unnamed protein product [Ceutorhynchus assimilis]|uniref:Choline transporter-like protein n=1 Tax=Ceutorhynchus assimilis TaxID=467358 RepID=A0A9N9QKR8_9CUCU|nr:unnamed protein product [Ceutorhynchus assimilis]